MDRAVTIAFNDWLYAKADADAKFVPPLLYLLGELEIHPDGLVHPRLNGAVQARSDQIEFDRPHSSGAVIQSTRRVRRRQAANGCGFNRSTRDY